MALVVVTSRKCAIHYAEVPTIMMLWAQLRITEYNQISQHLSFIIRDVVDAYHDFTMSMFIIIFKFYVSYGLHHAFRRIPLSIADHVYILDISLQMVVSRVGVGGRGGRGVRT